MKNEAPQPYGRGIFSQRFFGSGIPPKRKHLRYTHGLTPGVFAKGDKQFVKILKINSFLFPVLVPVAFLSLFIESISYIGFLRRYIFIDSRFFLIATSISALFLVGKKINILEEIVLKLNSIVLIASIILYVVMQLLEVSHFHNYVFSIYHIQPTNFLNVIFLSAIIFLISKLIKQKLFSTKLSIFKLATLFILAVVFFDGTVKTVDAAVYTDFYILSHINASYDFKMNERWGVYYDYIKFVKANTPEDSSILVPPQQLPWYSTGNVGLDRYFLFPRNMGNGSFDKPIDLKGYDYVLLVWGEWNDADKSAYGWPKIPIEAEKVIYFDPESGKVSEKEGSYDPKLSPVNGVWGIIKVKK